MNETQKMLSGNPDFIALLGTIPDKDLAERFGTDTYWVRMFRNSVGIPRVKARKYTKRGTGLLPEFIDALGTAPDKDLADRFNVPVGYVKRCRHRAGVKFKRGRKKRNIDVQTELRHRRRVQIQPDLILEKYPGIQERLSLQKNSEIAKYYGVSRERIRQIRSVLNISIIAKPPTVKILSPREPVRNLESGPQYELYQILIKGPLTTQEIADQWCVPRHQVSARLGTISSRGKILRIDGCPVRWALMEGK